MQRSYHAFDLQASSAEVSSSSTAAVALTGQKGDNLYVEPLARNLILGVGAGIACEAVHVFTKVKRLACEHCCRSRCGCCQLTESSRQPWLCMDVVLDSRC
jgi:hypothetical protein